MSKEHEKLYQDYLKLQSDETKKNINGYDVFIESDTKVGIKVRFKNGEWLRVYRDKDTNKIEWHFEWH